MEKMSRVVLNQLRRSHFVCQRSTNAVIISLVFIGLGCVMVAKIAQMAPMNPRKIVRTLLVDPISFSVKIGLVFLDIYIATTRKIVRMEATKKIVVSKNINRIISDVYVKFILIL